MLSFSAFVHAWAIGHGIASYLARYYPDVLQDRHVTEGLHGFFWLRRELELGWSHVRALIGATTFDTFHVHLAGDPGFPPVQSPPDQDLGSTTSRSPPGSSIVRTWMRSCGGERVFRASALRGHRTIIFGGNGRGQCVVAPDGPTMNEYIVHGVNGLRDDPRLRRPSTSRYAARLGREAQRGILAGRARWAVGEKALVDFIVHAECGAVWGPRTAGVEPRRPSVAGQRCGSLGFPSAESGSPEPRRNVRCGPSVPARPEYRTLRNAGYASQCAGLACGPTSGSSRLGGLV